MACGLATAISTTVEARAGVRAVASCATSAPARGLWLALFGKRTVHPESRVATSSLLDPHHQFPQTACDGLVTRVKSRTHRVSDDQQQFRLMPAEQVLHSCTGERRLLLHEPRVECRELLAEVRHVEAQGNARRRAMRGSSSFCGDRPPLLAAASVARQKEGWHKSRGLICRMHLPFSAQRPALVWHVHSAPGAIRGWLGLLNSHLRALARWPAAVSSLQDWDHAMCCQRTAHSAP